VCSVEVRLAGDKSTDTGGRLEVKVFGVWGTVCSEGFDDKDAQVACTMLGFK